MMMFRHGSHALDSSSAPARSSLVMLSLVLSAANGAAKQLAAQRDRPFAAAQGDSRGADDETSLYAALASFIIHM